MYWNKCGNSVILCVCVCCITDFMKTLTLMEATLEAENEVRKLTVMYDYVPKNSTCTYKQYNIIFLCSKLYIIIIIIMLILLQTINVACSST